MPNSALSNDTPYYRMFGKNYDISFMRVIGSRAFVHVRRHHEKLDKRAWEGILVGYDNDKPTYRIHNSPIGKIVGFRNVTFIGQVENSTHVVQG